VIRLAVTSQWTVTIYVGLHHSGTVFYNLLYKGKDFTSKVPEEYKLSPPIQVFWKLSIGISQSVRQAVKNSQNITALKRVQWQNDINRITKSNLWGSDDGLSHVNLNRL